MIYTLPFILLSAIAGFVIGGAIYVFLELIYDGDSHWSMFVLGGIAVVLCGYYDEWFFLAEGTRHVLIAITIVVMEYFVGKKVNDKFQIWDYRKMPYNFQGQICLTFTMLWIILAPVLEQLDNFIKYYVYYFLNHMI